MRKDRELTDRETREFDTRMAEDPTFSDDVEKSAAAWDLLDTMTLEAVDEFKLDSAEKPLLLRPVWRELSIAAILMAGFVSLWFFSQERSPRNDLHYVETRSTVDPWTQRLPDGSVIRLNAGAKILVKYTPDVRRVDLLLGEAHFTVAKHPDRPFVVTANRMKVQAVGTAFNVRIDIQDIDVLVTEGTVQIASEEVPLSVPDPAVVTHPQSLAGNSDNFVRSGQRAKVSLMGGARDVRVNIMDTNSSVLDESLAWQKTLLTLGGDSLEQIASSFQQKTGVKLIIADPDLNGLRIGGQFPSDNFKGFLQVLKSAYGIEWNERRDGTLVIGGSD